MFRFQGLTSYNLSVHLLIFYLKSSYIILFIVNLIFMNKTVLNFILHDNFDDML